MPYRAPMQNVGEDRAYLENEATDARLRLEARLRALFDRRRRLWDGVEVDQRLATFGDGSQHVAEKRHQDPACQIVALTAVSILPDFISI